MSNRGAPCETCGIRKLLDGLVGEDSRCPAWLTAEDTKFVETNVVTGEERLLEGCAIIENFRVLRLVVAASNRPAAEIGELRKESSDSLGRIEGAIPAAVQQALPAAFSVSVEAAMQKAMPGALRGALMALAAQRFAELAVHGSTPEPEQALPPAGDEVPTDAH